MPWSTDDIPDLDGRTAVVTGANGGLGLETARELARRGAHVVMAARNQKKAASAQADISGDLSDASLEIVPLDLGSLKSVREAAAQINDSHEKIDILVNNAGVMAMPEGRTQDGFETQLGINHLGHWALTARLMPALLRAPAARVVSVSSTAHHMGTSVDPDNPHLKGDYGPWKAYGQSKLANLHFGIGLQRCFEDAGASASSLVAHPGLTNSDLQSHTVEENEGDLGGK
ncbi:MAG: SDR family NAD(P)-dependent oxidoreductase, partial [Solirubrobacterales bacterium]